MEKIIYYHSQPIGPSGDSGSSVRPYQMLKAFSSLDIEIIPVIGSYNERKAIIRDQIIGNTDFLYMYAESSNTPLVVSNRYRLPLFNSMDIKLFKYLNNNNVPIGLFLRDIYWLFKGQHKKKSLLKRLFERSLRRFELKLYEQTVDVLFLPTEIMGDYLGNKYEFENKLALPPGCTDNSGLIKSHNNVGEKLELLYIGNITPPLYDLRKLVKLVSDDIGVSLNIICREKDWKRNKSLYQNYLSDNINIYHKSGNELIPFYSNADIFVAFRDHHPYLDITLPVKIPEAWGHGLPVIVKSGGKDAEWVDSLDGGWIVDNISELQTLLNKIKSDKNIIHLKKSKIKTIVEENSWVDRVNFVSKSLNHI